MTGLVVVFGFSLLVCIMLWVSFWCFLDMLFSIEARVGPLVVFRYRLIIVASL